MDKKRKIIIGILTVVFIIVFSGVLFVINVGHSGLPNYIENIKLNNLKSKVNVLRDKYGIPNIYAQNEEDLYRATGYVMAQDRMWQMDLLRRVTTGKLSEILGADFIDADVLLRSLRIPEKSKTIIDSSEIEVKNALNAFADGVNQYINSHQNDLPFEFSILGYKPEQWTPEHTINLIGYMSWDLSMSWNSEIILFKLKQKIDKLKYQELLPDLDLQKTPILPEFSLKNNISDSTILSACTILQQYIPEIFNGSNNWAVSGKKSVTGKPILANDMHLGLSVPGIWFQMHQHVENGIDVTGVSLPGAPFIISGHNKDIAWGLTNVMLDDIDFYEETINSSNSNQYKFNGEWKNLEIHKEIIKIGSDKTVEKEIKFTHRGPIISNTKKIEKASISMRWIGNEYSNELRTIYRLNKAKNWTEFKDAVKTFKAVSQNIAYADKNGNIGLYVCAGIPKRICPGTEVFPGETNKYDWKGFVPFDSLPHVYNPQSGFVCSANNKSTTKNYPYYISSWYDLSYRADRIAELLSEKEKLSVEDFQRIQTDRKSKLSEEMTPIILKEVLKKSDLNKQEKEAVELLQKWDFVCSKDSPETLIFEQFFLNFAKNIFKDEMGEKLYDEFLKLDLMSNYSIDRILKTGKSIWFDNVSTQGKIETKEEIFQKTFSETVVQLSKMSGKMNKLKWGDAHQLQLQHPLGKVWFLNLAFDLNREKIPVGGSFHTVSPFSYNFQKPFNSASGASHRQIYNFADFDKSVSVIPTGNSGIPSSKHYCDQTNLYTKDLYHPDYFSKKKIDENTVYKMSFLP